MNHRARISLTVGFSWASYCLCSVLTRPAPKGFPAAVDSPHWQKRHLSGVVSVVLDPDIASNRTSLNAQAFSALAAPSLFPGLNGKCDLELGSNVKVNQDCLNLSDRDLQGRSQAQNETSIAQDPNAPNHLVASFNDYRRGDGTCGAPGAWMGEILGTTLPYRMASFAGAAYGAARQYFQGGGDTAVAWDTKGNAYLQCQLFMRGPVVTNNPDTSSAIYVFRATGNHGTSWNFTGARW